MVEKHEIMAAIGLTSHITYHDGNHGCARLRRKVIQLIGPELQKHGLQLHKSWENILALAAIADEFDGGDYALSNTWRACDTAIGDAIRGEGRAVAPTRPWVDFQDKAKEEAFNKFIQTRSELMKIARTKHRPECSRPEGQQVRRRSVALNDPSQKT